MDYLKTEDDITAYLKAVTEDGNPALSAVALDDVARARAKNNERRHARMAAALKVSKQMEATKRFDPPPADEAVIPL